MKATNQNLKQILNDAEKLFSSGEYEAASEKYLLLVNSPQCSHLAYYRLAAISNITRDPVTAKDLYYKAFELKPDICKSVFPENHPNHNYVFHGKKDETPQESCPLCGERDEPYWCYPVVEMGSDHVQAYNPVRVWVRCNNCIHLYAEEFPEQKICFSKNPSPNNAVVMPTRPQLFSFYSEVLFKLLQFSKGNELLEIGIGGSELALAACEMGFSVFGVDISEENVIQAKKYGINAQLNDFMQFETTKKWDIIAMGDVIEHVSDPVGAMEKVSHMLTDNGVIWLSTPNYEAAYSMFAGHKDAMRREASHKNYFSRISLFNLLERFGFVTVDYRISSHYNGSMEVIAIKKEGITDYPGDD